MPSIEMQRVICKDIRGDIRMVIRQVIREVIRKVFGYIEGNENYVRDARLESLLSKLSHQA